MAARTLYTLVTVIVFAAVAAGAATLRWEFPQGHRLEATRTAQVRFLVNGREQRRYDERNIIDLTCTERKENGSQVAGRFSVYARERGQEVFNLREQYQSAFQIAPRGLFTVPQKQYMPNLRNVPLFPDEALEPGATWTATGELVISSFAQPFMVSFPVHYTLKEIVKEKEGEVALISYRYRISAAAGLKKPDPAFPVKVEGGDEGTIRWDLTRRRPLEQHDKYRMVFFFSDGRAREEQEFQMLIDTVYVMHAPVSDEDKKKDQRELQKELPAESGVEVDVSKRGIVLRLGDILFDFDSYAVRKDMRERLARVADVLKQKYPDREIIVEGHTDNRGTRAHNDRLSVNRARTVAEFLKARGGNDRLSYRGLGAGSPIAGNDTPEGRQRNRRVEIIIKMH